jgi:hypothetical protein
MSKSKINVIIAGNTGAQPCRSLATPNDFGPIAAAFFLVFDCANVETSAGGPSPGEISKPR